MEKPAPPADSSRRDRVDRSDVGLALVATAVFAALWFVGWLPAVERSVGDLLLRVPWVLSTGEPPVAAVLIDDEAVAKYGSLPWPRGMLARLVRALEERGARGVVLDIILSEPSDAADDQALSDALAGTEAILAAAIDSRGAWLMPLEEFGGAGEAAHVFGEIGPDGVVRTIATTKQAKGVALPALSVAAARILRPEWAVPVATELRPAFRPSPTSIDRCGAAAVLSGAFNPDDVKGRVVFLGVSATGSGDQFVVPTGPAHAPVPGVLAHASAAASILEDRLLHVPGTSWTLLAALLLAFAVQVLRSRRQALDPVALAALLAALGLVAVAVLQLGHVLLPVAGLGAVIVISALLREAAESQAARRESGRLLQSLLVHLGARPETAPRSANRSLQAIRNLQERVLQEDATRQALLAGMEEGVVLWGHDGTLLEANAAAHRLWGGPLQLDDVLGTTAEAGDHELRRKGLDLALHLSDVEAGRLCLIRDISAERDLERRRHEMQRLVSHELKTPLASISGLGEALERYQVTGEELRHIAALIRGEAGRLHEMVTVFLDLERLGAGQWEGTAETVDLSELVRRRVEVLGAAAESSGKNLVTHIDQGCHVRGVATLLERVVDNLVGNAIKYSFANADIEVAVRCAAETAGVEVGDQGPGIAPEALPRVFERFYRAPGAEGTGAGLGLALVKEVVDWHGGCIEVDSEVGVGSRFVVTLPAAKGS